MAGRTATKVSTVQTSVSGALNDATDGVHSECLYAVNDTSNDSTTIYNGPALLFGIFVNTVLSAHTVVIQDNATAVITLPASLAAGTNLTFPGIRFETSLVCNPNDSSTGNITIMYKPI
jgi:hypothetical protein